MAQRPERARIGLSVPVVRCVTQKGSRAMEPHDPQLNRRNLLKWGSAALIGSSPLLRAARLLGQSAPFCPPGLTEEPCRTGVDALEAYPTSPFVLYPFTDALKIPAALARAGTLPAGI